MRAKQKENKKIRRRKIFASSVALLLVAGLLLSAVIGFADFMIDGNRKKDPPATEDYPSLLERLAASLEQQLAAAPDDEKLKMQLADIYLELAMAHGSSGAAELRDRYALKGEELLQQIVSAETAELVLKLALVTAYYQENDLKGESLFHRALELDPEHTEALFYYGIFLALRGRGQEARDYLEKVLELEPENSYLAELARLAMEEYLAE